MYSTALMRYCMSRAYKKQSKNDAAKLGKKIMQLERGNHPTASLVLLDTHIVRLKQQLKDVLKHKEYNMDEFQNPELASQRPLDMGRPWKM
jgi:hypothetical protein